MLLEHLFTIRAFHVLDKWVIDSLQPVSRPLPPMGSLSVLSLQYGHISCSYEHIDVV